MEATTPLTADERKERSDKVLRARYETRERRERLAAEFRARLRAELGNAPPSASTDGLIDVATSAYVQIVELSARYNRALANPKHVQALSLARGQLSRALILLGRASYNPEDTPQAEPAEPGAPRSLAEWTERWRARKAAEATPEAER